MKDITISCPISHSQSTTHVSVSTDGIFSLFGHALKELYNRSYSVTYKADDVLLQCLHKTGSV
jgi:hypothetical protein